MGIKLTLGEKKWHGSRYYTVTPYLTSWSLTANNNKWNEIVDWCYDTFGIQGDAWDNKLGLWYFNNSTFWFRNEDDRTIFVLRWT